MYIYGPLSVLILLVFCPLFYCLIVKKLLCFFWYFIYFIYFIIVFCSELLYVFLSYPLVFSPILYFFCLLYSLNHVLYPWVYNYMCIHISMLYFVCIIAQSYLSLLCLKYLDHKNHLHITISIIISLHLPEFF